MELDQVVQRIHELTGRFFTLTKEEVKELQLLSRNFSVECAEILYDWDR